MKLTALIASTLVVLAAGTAQAAPGSANLSGIAAKTETAPVVHIGYKKKSWHKHRWTQHRWQKNRWSYHSSNKRACKYRFGKYSCVWR